jgi:proline iminopeptidase
MSEPAKPATDGFVKVLGYNLFYESFEPEDEKIKGTLLCLHGGPGTPHNYLSPLADLARLGYRVVFYDQLGVGKSEMPKNKFMFSIEYGVEEVEAFRKEMKLGKIHLFGSSYGGLLAIAYALKYQKNLLSLITAGGLASVPLTVSEMRRLKSLLPPEVQSTLEKYEAEGDFENPEYVKAAMIFYRTYICRLPEWPADFQYSVDNVSRPVYGLMNGPNEFTIVGNMMYWDATEKLHLIKVPTLVTGGRYDEVTPRVARAIHNGVKGSKLVIFPKSSHVAFWEEREKYMRVVGSFLDGIGTRRRRS